MCTSFLLRLLAWLARRCSHAPTRGALCGYVSTLLEAFNSGEAEAAAGGGGVLYLLHHPHRVRHAMMQHALRQAAEARSARSSISSSSSKAEAPLPFSSAQKRNLELGAELEGAKTGARRERGWRPPL